MYEAKNGFEKDLQFRFSRLRLNTFALVAMLVLSHLSSVDLKLGARWRHTKSPRVESLPKKPRRGLRASIHSPSGQRNSRSAGSVSGLRADPVRRSNVAL